MKKLGQYFGAVVVLLMTLVPQTSAEEKRIWLQPFRGIAVWSPGTTLVRVDLHIPRSEDNLRVRISYEYPGQMGSSSWELQGGSQATYERFFRISGDLKVLAELDYLDENGQEKTARAECTVPLIGRH